MKWRRQRLQTWQSPCLPSDIFSKSSGRRPVAHLPWTLLASSAHVARATRGEHSSRRLRVQSGGRGCLLLNTIFTRKDERHLLWKLPPLDSGLLLICTLDHTLHACYPSSVHSLCSPTTTHNATRSPILQPSSQTVGWQLKWPQSRVVAAGPLCPQTISGTKRFLVTELSVATLCLCWVIQYV